jgi:hypothetical protein
MARSKFPRNGRVALFPGLSCEVRSASQKPLLYLWPENYSLTRRVLATSDHCHHRLAVACRAVRRSKPDRLEFIRLEFESSATYPARLFAVATAIFRGIPSRRRVWQLFLFVKLFTILSCLRNALFRIPQAQ